jgi:hypothetical protein
MPRYGRILSATFEGEPLPLPMAVRVKRGVAAEPRCGSADAHCPSVQTAPRPTRVELDIRDAGAAEALVPGASGRLETRIAAATGDSGGRALSLESAVLVDVQTTYRQDALAVATLVFVGEATGPDTDPWQAEGLT